MSLKDQCNSFLLKIQSSKTLRYRVYGVVVGIVIILFLSMWIYNNRYISTDDAYINANVVQVSSRVNGPVVKLDVVNNQLVKRGQRLFALDPVPFQVAVEKARAQLAQATAELVHAKYTTARTETLVKQKVLPSQSHDDAVVELQKALADVQLNQALLRQAELDLHYTQIFAATDGWIANMTLREGNMVSANQLLFALISSDGFWVDANFKETELQSIHSGQNATVKVDMYPHYVFTGVVESVSGSSGTAFSLLPPQNATGNWVKIAQRVPVKVRITNNNPNYSLRIGTTATVTIDSQHFLH